MTDTPIQPRKSLADIVYERLLRTIGSGTYRPDERLPTEHDLAAEFGVSRPVVREALQRLREQGLIYSRRGSGSFVRAAGRREPAAFGPLENVANLLQCYEFRLTVEAQAAACAAERRSAEALDRITLALELMRDAPDRPPRREEANFRFHHAIAVAAENDYFATAVTALQGHVAVGARFHGVVVRRDASGPGSAFAEHVAIHDAIRARDPEAARRLMRAHLSLSRDRMFEGQPGSSTTH